MVVVVSDVPEVERAYQNHGCGHLQQVRVRINAIIIWTQYLSEELVLLGSNAEVHQHPQDQSRASLAEQLKVEAGKESM